MRIIPPLVERHVGDAAFYWQQRYPSAHSPLLDWQALRHCREGGNFARAATGGRPYRRAGRVAGRSFFIGGPSRRRGRPLCLPLPSCGRRKVFSMKRIYFTGIRITPL